MSKRINDPDYPDAHTAEVWKKLDPPQPAKVQKGIRDPHYPNARSVEVWKKLDPPRPAKVQKGIRDPQYANARPAEVWKKLDPPQPAVVWKKSVRSWSEVSANSSEDSSISEDAIIIDSFDSTVESKSPVLTISDSGEFIHDLQIEDLDVGDEPIDSENISQFLLQSPYGNATIPSSHARFLPPYVGEWNPNPYSRGFLPQEFIDDKPDFFLGLVDTTYFEFSYECPPPPPNKKYHVSVNIYFGHRTTNAFTLNLPILIAHGSRGGKAFRFRLFKDKDNFNSEELERYEDTLEDFQRDYPVFEGGDEDEDDQDEVHPGLKFMAECSVGNRDIANDLFRDRCNNDPYFLAPDYLSNIAMYYSGNDNVTITKFKIVCNGRTILLKDVGAQGMHTFTDDIFNRKLSHIPGYARNNPVLITAYNELGNAWHPKYGNTFFGYEDGKKVSVRSWCSAFVKWALKHTYPHAYYDMKLGGVGITQYMLKHERLYTPPSPEELDYPLNLAGGFILPSGYSLGTQIGYHELGNKLKPGSYIAVSPKGSEIDDWHSNPQGSELGHKYNYKYYQRGFHAAIFAGFPNGFDPDGVNEMASISGADSHKVDLGTYYCWDFSAPPRKWISFAWTSEVWKYNDKGEQVIDCFADTSG